MTRCNKCLLTDSLIGSNFNNQGECYWCRTNFPNYNPKGVEKLKIKINENKREKSDIDCLVGLSGGKDSSYALMKLKNELNLRVEAFIYIHEGSTKFSIDNAELICKELDVKLHKVSLKKNAHLKSFKSFFKAWLDSPSTIKTGMTCVACKHLHILGLEIAKQRNIPMIVWSTSPLEYSPFLAIQYKPSESNQFKRESLLKSASMLFKETLSSPKFTLGILQNFKTSYLGSLAAFPTSGYLKRKYPSVTPIMFYDYYNWNPKEIIKELESKTSWRIPDYISDDWHSDCVFNIFKEYMFQKMLGVTYTDAHLSNQIRYGIISREEAVVQLRKSKMRLPFQLKEALKELDLDYLSDRIDFDCFNEEIE